MDTVAGSTPTAKAAVVAELHGVLPPLGVGLSASCYQKWRDQQAGVDAALDWLGEAVRGTELMLLSALDERFEAVREVFARLVAGAVGHGLLLVQPRRPWLICPAPLADPIRVARWGTWRRHRLYLSRHPAPWMCQRQNARG